MGKLLPFLILIFISLGLSAQKTEVLTFKTEEVVNNRIFAIDTLIEIERTHTNPYYRFQPLLFKQNVFITGCRFSKFADFSGATFNYNVEFSKDTFYNGADFSGVTFQESVDFSNSRFTGIANFSFARFLDIGDFSNLDTTESAPLLFKSSILPSLIDFTNNNIHYTIDFSKADFSNQKRYSDSAGWHYINLFFSDVSKVKIDYQHFRLCFFIEDKDYNLNNLHKEIYEYYKDSFELRIKGENGKTYLICENKEYLLSKNREHWYIEALKIKDVRDYLHLIFPSAYIHDPNDVWIYNLLKIFHSGVSKSDSNYSDPVIKIFLNHCFTSSYGFPRAITDEEIYAIYERELKNFENNGQKLSYQKLDIEYRDFKNDWFILPHIWNCYGYEKWWIFLWTFGFVIFFTIITYFIIDKLNNKTDGVYHITNIPVVDKSKYKKMSIKVKATKFWYSLMYTTTIFFLLSLKIENINFRKKGLLAYIFLIYSVGLLCLGYIANFVLQK